MRPSTRLVVLEKNIKPDNTILVPASLISSLPIGSTNTITSVSIPNFNIGTTDVTGALWSEVRTWALANGYTNINAGTNAGSTTLPIGSLNWYSALVWLNAYSERSGLNPVYRDSGGNILRNAFAFSTINNAVQSNNNGYRLPTANEWEMAARWLGTTAPTVGSLATERITTTNNGVTYYWTPGNYASGATENTSNATETGNVARYSANNSPSSIKPVGTRRANALNLFDVSGNMLELQSPLSGGTTQLMRGGNFFDSAADVSIGQIQNFVVNEEAVYSSSVGLRVVRN